LGCIAGCGSFVPTSALDLSGVRPDLFQSLLQNIRLPDGAWLSAGQEGGVPQIKEAFFCRRDHHHIVGGL